MVQSQFGFCCSQVPSQLAAMENGLGVVTPFAVVARPRPARDAPRSRPYQRGCPLVLTGPDQILFITAASVAVMVPQECSTPISWSAFQ